MSIYVLGKEIGQYVKHNSPTSLIRHCPTPPTASRLSAATVATMLAAPLHCNPLQHAAIHCNALPQLYSSPHKFATPPTELCLSAAAIGTLLPAQLRCNTLQHTATYCNAPQQLHSSPRELASPSIELRLSAAAIVTLLAAHSRCNILQHTATNYIYHLTNSQHHPQNCVCPQPPSPRYLRRSCA